MTKCGEGAKAFAQIILVTIRFRLVRAGDGHADIIGLFLAERGQRDAKLFKVQGGDFLVEMLRQHIDVVLVVALLLA